MTVNPPETPETEHQNNVNHQPVSDTPTESVNSKGTSETQDNTRAVVNRSQDYLRFLRSAREIDTNHPRVGTSVNDRFLILGVINPDYTAEMVPTFLVRRAESMYEHELYALKLLPGGFLNPAARDKMLHEVQILNGALKDGHEFVLGLTDYNLLPKGELFLARKFIDEGTLRDLVKTRGGALPINECLEIFEKIADALDYVHQCGVVHRDIRPDNILVKTREEIGSQYVPYLTDFDISKHIPEGTNSRLTPNLNHSPDYRAPELYNGVVLPQLYHRADIYSFGVTLYECLEGKLPFDGGNYGTSLPFPAEKTITQVNRFAAEVLLRALKKDPAERPQSATELMRELRKAYDLGNQMVAELKADNQRLVTELTNKKHELSIARINLRIAVGAVILGLFGSFVQAGLLDSFFRPTPTIAPTLIPTLTSTYTPSDTPFPTPTFTSTLEPTVTSTVVLTTELPALPVAPTATMFAFDVVVIEPGADLYRGPGDHYRFLWRAAPQERFAAIAEVENERGSWYQIRRQSGESVMPNDEAFVSANQVVVYGNASVDLPEPANILPSPTPTSSLTATPNPTNTPTYTPTATSTFTHTRMPTITHTATPTPSPTATHTHTPDATLTPSPTPNPTLTWTPSMTPTPPIFQVDTRSGEVANLRTGAGSDFGIAGRASVGTELWVYGQRQNQGNVWYEVSTTSLGNRRLWIRGDQGRLLVDGRSIPLSNSTPAATLPARTATPTPNAATTSFEPQPGSGGSDNSGGDNSGGGVAPTQPPSTSIPPTDPPDPTVTQAPCVPPQCNEGG